MEFHDYAAQETSALIQRVLGRRSEELLRELQKFRQALDAAVQAAETALGAPARIEQSEELLGVVERLTAAATAQAQDLERRSSEEAQTAIEAVRAELKEQLDQKQKIAAAYADAQAVIEAARAELKERVDEKQKLAASYGDAQKAIEAARADLKERVKEHKKLTSSLEAVRAEREQHANEREKLAVSLKQLQTEMDALREELQAANERAEAGSVEAARARDAQAQAGATLTETEAASQRETRARAAAEAELTVVRARLDENDRTVRVLQDRLQAAAAAEGSPRRRAGEAEREVGKARAEAGTEALDRLLTMFQSVAKAGTIADVSAALVRALSGDFSRVALFSVKGNRLEGTHHVGLDFKSDISKVVIPLTIETPLSQAVASGRVESRTASELTDSSRALFGGAPTLVLALPVVVDRETIAVIYADDSDQPPAESTTLERRVKFAELLRQHSAPLLLSLSAELKALAELRDYATLLLNEVEYLYTADAAAGMTGAELQRHLKDNLQCARGIYAQRIKSEGPYAAPLLEERLAGIIGAKTSTPFGRDLAAVAGGKDQPRERTASHPAAEAS